MPPAREPPENGPEDSAFVPLSAQEFLTELSTLITEIEQAKTGDEALDLRLHYGFRILGGFGEDMASILIKEGVSWPTVQATLNEIVPPYSTSLDASLQGEEIVFSVRSAKGQRWGAMQRTSTGGEELAWAATEPLARRLAALKYHHAELKKTLEDDSVFSGPIDTVGMAIAQTAKSGVDESAVTEHKE